MVDYQYVFTQVVANLADKHPTKGYKDCTAGSKCLTASWSAVRCVVLLTVLGGLLNSGCESSSIDTDSMTDGLSVAWSMYGNDYSNTRYSALEQVNTNNVKDLKVAWIFPLGILEAQQSTPIMVHNTLYVTTSNGPRFVYALDAKTGVLNWMHEFEIPEDVQRYACCGIVNRGAAFSDGKVFVGRLDGYLTALNAKTGKESWSVQVVDYKQGSVITSPPLIVGNKVISGFGGGEYGARGYLTAFDTNSGREMWKTWTIPGPGEPGNESWKGDSWQTGGGAAWFVGSYDPNLNLVYWGTSNPSPWTAVVRGPDRSDYGEFTNRHSASTLALDADTGEIRWHYQTTPHDAWDYDGVNELVLADLNINGENVPALMKADRNGFFYVINRETGKLISAEPFVPVNWAERIDLETGLPVENAEKRPTATHKAKDIYPSWVGGKNWEPMAYNPNTGLVYIPANNLAMTMTTGEVVFKRGFFYLGTETETYAGPGNHIGALLAWDPVKQQKAWSVKQKFPVNGGTLTTAGNLVFFGNIEGKFEAFNASSGELLWSFNAGSGINAAPMTYQVDGKQYMAVTVGRPTVIPGGELGKQMVEATPASGIVIAFNLP